MIPFRCAAVCDVFGEQSVCQRHAKHSSNISRFVACSSDALLLMQADCAEQCHTFLFSLLVCATSHNICVDKHTQIAAKQSTNQVQLLTAGKSSMWCPHIYKHRQGSMGLPQAFLYRTPNGIVFSFFLFSFFFFFLQAQQYQVCPLLPY